jgi:hypothetical protein
LGLILLGVVLLLNVLIGLLKRWRELQEGGSTAMPTLGAVV